VKRLVEFCVTEHHHRIPHAAFEGQTPDETYFGRGADGEETARVDRECDKVFELRDRGAPCASAL
jgi:hypothetical protein